MIKNAPELREAFEQALTEYHRVHVAFIDQPGGAGPEDIPLPLIVPREVLIPLGKTQYLHSVFEYGYNLAKPIQDLEVNDDGIGATLSFSNEPVQTFIPWEYVLEMTGLDPIKKPINGLKAV